MFGLAKHERRVTGDNAASPPQRILDVLPTLDPRVFSSLTTAAAFGEFGLKCDGACKGGIAIGILDFFAKTFDSWLGSRKIRRHYIRELRLLLHPLAVSLDQAECGELYALAVKILSRSVFCCPRPSGRHSLRSCWVGIEEYGTFIWDCFSLINEIWLEAHGTTRGEAFRPPHSASPFDVEELLQSWTDALPDVPYEYLRHYIQALGCKGIHECRRFEDTLATLAEHFSVVVIPRNAPAADWAVCALLSRVLAPHLGHDEAVVLKCLPAVTRMATEIALRAGITDPLRQLAKLGKQFSVVLFNPDGSVCEDRSALLRESCDPVYKELNSVYRRMPPEMVPALTPYLEQLIPLYQFRPPRPRHRRARDGSRVKLTVMVKGESKTWEGEIIDFSEEAEALLARFDTLTECHVLKGTEEVVDAQVFEETHKSVILQVAEKTGESTQVCEATAELILPGYSPSQTQRGIPTTLWAKRGWTYAGENRIGAVFLVSAAKKIEDYVKSLPRAIGSTSASRENDILRQPTSVGIAPFKPGELGMLQGVESWFSAQGMRILDSKGWRRYWHKNQPAEEAQIEAIVREPLTEYVKSRGAHLAPGEESGLGPCDYVVSRGTEQVVIELKRSVVDWQQGISDELPGHLLTKAAECGLFVLYDFKDEFRESSDKLARLLDCQQAVCFDSKKRIDVIVMCVAKLVSASRRRGLPRLHDVYRCYQAR